MRNTTKLALVLLGLFASNSAYSQEKDKNKTEEPETISLDYMDTEVSPKEDFFRYANGNWIKNNPVPPSESRWGSFNELEQANISRLTTILADAVVNGKKSDGTKLIGDYYASFCNQKIRDQKGTSPIADLLKQIQQIDDRDKLYEMLAALHKRGIDAAFRFGVSQDMKDVKKHIASFGQGGLTLPNRDYYLEENYAEIREAYLEHMSKMVRLMGWQTEETHNLPEVVLKFETELANAMLSPAEMRKPENRYRRASLEKARQYYLANFDFDKYLEATEIGEFDVFNVGNEDYSRFISGYLYKIDLKTWRAYLLWRTLDHYAGHLSSEFVQQSFEFYGKVLSGKSAMKPVNERAIKEITRMEIGEILGRAFVEEHYSSEAQEAINLLVDNLLVVFRKRIEGLEWMSQTTKDQALLKLNSIGRKLGFPEEWKDFGELEFNPEDYIGNMDMAAMNSFQRNLDKLDKPVDEKEWGMPAHMVNAYYHPLMNEIAFPAGIMQPPFFSADYEDAVNYGRIGMVIGHEFTHGFDDNGSRFDAEGNFKNWWTESDRELFEKRTETLGSTFAGFCPIEGHCVNPQLTMGENIADLGGLTLAYHAYTRTREFKSGKKRSGFTPAQRFFIAYAQLWKINFTDAELKKRIATDPHSPGMYRVNGPLMNCPEFFEAFNVKEGDPMRNKEAKVAKIW